MLISVAIPSRLQAMPNSTFLWLERALDSVARQSICGKHDLEIIVGLDPYTTSPANFANVRFVQGSAPLQANVLNAAVTTARGEVLAFLEDDDIWQPQRLEIGLLLLDHFDFVSSNQFEITEHGEPAGINDFATPSGWLMRCDTWRRLGPLDESYRYHLDNEYLGRMTILGIRRAHLVERDAELRSRLAELSEVSAIVRAPVIEPLVIRTRNSQGGMASIAAGGNAAARSQEEYSRLRARFGRIPF